MIFNSPLVKCRDSFLFLLLELDRDKQQIYSFEVVPRAPLGWPV